MHVIEPSRQQGAALIVALLALALVVAIAVELSLAGAGTSAYVRNRLWYEQQYQHAIGAEARALQRLRQWHGRNAAPPIASHLDAIYALPEGGRVEVAVRDWQGRFNINNLAVGQGVVYGKKFPATIHQRRFVRLLQAMPEFAMDEASAREWAARITDWVDSDKHDASGAIEFNGMQAPNRPLMSIAELQALPGMPEDLYEALVRYVMAWPSTVIGINLNAANTAVLRSLPEHNGMQPVAMSEIEPLLVWQETQGFSTLEQFRQVSGWQGNTISVTGLTVQSNLFSVEASVIQGDQRTRLYSLMRRSGRQWNNVWRNPYGY